MKSCVGTSPSSSSVPLPGGGCAAVAVGCAPVSVGSSRLTESPHCVFFGSLCRPSFVVGGTAVSTAKTLSVFFFFDAPRGSRPSPSFALSGRPPCASAQQGARRCRARSWPFARARVHSCCIRPPCCCITSARGLPGLCAAASCTPRQAGVLQAWPRPTRTSSSDDASTASRATRLDSLLVRARSLFAGCWRSACVWPSTRARRDEQPRCRASRGERARGRGGLQQVRG